MQEAHQHESATKFEGDLPVMSPVDSSSDESVPDSYGGNQPITTIHRIQKCIFIYVWILQKLHSYKKSIHRIEIVSEKSNRYTEHICR